jgi:hypothetical protein
MSGKRPRWELYGNQILLHYVLQLRAFLRQHRPHRQSHGFGLLGLCNRQVGVSISRPCFFGADVADGTGDADGRPRIRIILLPARPSR